MHSPSCCFPTNCHDLDIDTSDQADQDEGEADQYIRLIYMKQ